MLRIILPPAIKFVKGLPPPLQLPLRRWGKSALLHSEALSARVPVLHREEVRWIAPEISDYERSPFLGPRPGELLVEAICTAVSTGTEIAGYLGLPGANRGFPYVPGYSGVGRVVRVGAKRSVFQVGDLVAGRLKHASHSILAEAMAFRIPHHTCPESAAFLELGIIALQSLRKSPLSAGAPVVVIGAGVVGHLAMRLLRCAGAAPIVNVASTERRRDLSLSPGGAEIFCLAGSDSAQHLTPLVFEATGTPSGFAESLRWVEDGGCIILLGSTRGLSAPTKLYETLATRGIRLVGAHITGVPEYESSPGRWTYRDEGLLYLRLVSQGRLDMRAGITHRLSPNELPRFYRACATGEEQPVGVLIDWGRR